MIHIIMLKDYAAMCIYMNLSNTKGSSNKRVTIKVFVCIFIYSHSQITQWHGDEYLTNIGGPHENSHLSVLHQLTEEENGLHILLSNEDPEVIHSCLHG